MPITFIDGEPPSRYSPTLRDLIRVGLLPFGAMLTCTRNGAALRAVGIDGGMYVEGHGYYEHPAPAARKPSGAISSGGWLDWRLPDGRPLDDLRKQYRRGEY